MIGKCQICGVEADVFKIRPIREGEGSDWQPTVCRPCAIKLMPNPPRSQGQAVIAPEALETRPQEFQSVDVGPIDPMDQALTRIRGLLR